MGKKIKFIINSIVFKRKDRGLTDSRFLGGDTGFERRGLEIYVQNVEGEPL